MSTPHFRFKSAARKLPIKRKTPDSSSPNPNPNSPPLNESKSEIVVTGKTDVNSKLKFHRIWQEADEIYFLQSLLDSANSGLVFPRDLNLFYAGFSGKIAQSFTRAQLGEKIRRLRKKFRVISGRISRGLDPTFLSPHDKALFHLSNQLWNPSFSSSLCPSPSLSHLTTVIQKEESKISNSNSPSPVVIEKVEPRVRVSDPSRSADPVCNMRNSNGRNLGSDLSAAKIVIDAFDRSLQEVRMVLIRRMEAARREKTNNWCARWREQRLAELDVMAHRLRLVLENSSQ